MIDNTERKSKWEYRCVDADGIAIEPVRDVRFPRDVELIDAAQFAAETEHDRMFLAERMHNIEDRAVEVDGVGQVFDFITKNGVKRLRVISRVKFTYDDVREE